MYCDKQRLKNLDNHNIIAYYINDQKKKCIYLY